MAPASTQARKSKWRETYRVHPAAAVFRMLPDDELDTLAADIKANGLTSQISFFVPENVLNATIDYVKANGILADGRNRMEAMERAGVELTPCAIETVFITDPDQQIAFIKGRNLHRRHMLKSERADAIVALAKMEAEPKPGQAGPVSEAKGGRGKKSPIKAKAKAINAELPEEQQVSERTIKRAIAKDEAKKPKPAPKPTKPKPEPGEGWVDEDGNPFVPLRSLDPNDPFGRLNRAFLRAPQAVRDQVIGGHFTRLVSIEATRRNYLLACEWNLDDLDAEQKLIIDALREIAGKRLDDKRRMQ